MVVVVPAGTRAQQWCLVCMMTMRAGRTRSAQAEHGLCCKILLQLQWCEGHPSSGVASALMHVMLHVP